MYLKMDENGEIYHETLDGERRYPGMGQDSNNLALSEKEDPQVLKDREKIAYAERKQQEARAARRINRQLSEHYKEQQQLQMGHVIYTQNQMLAKKLNDRYASVMQNAAKFHGYEDMQMSGVSGHGLTSDGRAPRPDEPPHDWKPVVGADYAFGRYDEQAADFGAAFETLFETATLGPFTTLDQYLMDQWKNNTFTIKYGLTPEFVEDKPHLSTIKDRTYVVDWDRKKYIDRKNREFVSSKTQTKYAQQGWKWSGYWEDGEFHLVKVKNIYGLPFIDINVEEGTRDFEQHEKWLKWRPTGNNYSFELFRDLSPVIKAFGKKFLYEQGELGTEETRLEFEQAALSQEEADVGTKTEQTIFDRLKWLFTGGDEGPQGYSHPMVQYNLVKRKK